MKFKGEIFLLLAAIALFTASAFMYSYTNLPQGEILTASTLAVPTYPYQAYAFSFLGFGSVLMTTASLSFLKRSKPPTVNAKGGLSE